MSRGDVEFVRSLFEGAGTRYDAVVRAATVGMDVLWKRRIHASIPDDREYDRILDLGCGTGIVTFGLAARYPDAEVVGLDASPDMLTVARGRTDRQNVRFVEKPAAEMSEFGRDAFDLATASYLPKYTDVDRLATDTVAVLGDDGVAVFHDFTYPEAPAYRALFDAYWAVISRVLKHVDGYESMSAELRDVIVDASDWPAGLRASLRREGFDRVTIDRQPLQVAAIVAGYDGGDS